MIDLSSKLLRQYADALIEHQFLNKDPSIDGGIFCPACKVIHGRSIDAIYGLAVAYKRFHEEKYLKAAEALLCYSSNLVCLDGGIYNDLQTTWRYTTVFFAIDIAEALLFTKDVLPPIFVKKLENHLLSHADWLYHNLDEHSGTNINYPVNNALAMYLAGSYLHNGDYLKRAAHLAEYSLAHLSPSGFLIGEGKPHNKVTKRGCNAIDIGYNLEESLPALAKYAYYSKNEGMLETVYQAAIAHLDFILPDGAIDNSFGCRSYKWTYYGSRTCDGFLPLAVIYAKKDPRFLEAAYRNLELMERCSIKGLLSGGPDYKKHHEEPCIHHTFEHLNAIAFALSAPSEGPLPMEKREIPSDRSYFAYYPEMDSYRVGTPHFLFDIACYDENLSYSGHPSGASLSLLYSRKKGPLIVGSVGDYELTEPTNMQVPLDTLRHRPLLPRFEVKKNGKLYSSAYFSEAKRLDEGKFSFLTGLMSRDEEKLEGSDFRYEYAADGDKFRIHIDGPHLDTPFILPLVNGEIRVKKGKIVGQEEIFFLTPGFLAVEYRIESEANEIEIEIS